MQKRDMFEEIYEREFDRVYRICRLMLGNTTDAEDCTQITFTKFLAKPVTFTDFDHEKAWFITVSRNCCKDFIKSAWKSRVDMPGEFEVPEPEQTDSELLDTIMMLPEKYREALYLYYYEGFKVKDIAMITQSNESTIQSRLKNARDKLKEMLTGERKRSAG